MHLSPAWPRPGWATAYARHGARRAAQPAAAVRQCGSMDRQAPASVVSPRIRVWVPDRARASGGLGRPHDLANAAAQCCGLVSNSAACAIALVSGSRSEREHEAGMTVQKDYSYYIRGNRVGVLLIHWSRRHPGGDALRRQRHGAGRLYRLLPAARPAIAAPRRTSRPRPGRTGTPAPSRRCSRCAQACDTVIVSGLSTGAVLALLLAARHPKDVHGAALFAPVFWLNGWIIPWYVRFFNLVSMKSARQPLHLPRYRAARHQGRPRARVRSPAPCSAATARPRASPPRPAAPCSSTAGSPRWSGRSSRTSISPR